jgi:Outer membrane protein beta-barrel domain
LLDLEQRAGELAFAIRHFEGGEMDFKMGPGIEAAFQQRSRTAQSSSPVMSFWRMALVAWWAVGVIGGGGGITGVAQAAEEAAAAPKDFEDALADELDESAGPPRGQLPDATNTKPATQADLEEAVRQAEAAADEAWLAARAADRRLRESEKKDHQSGPLVGAAFAYAAEHFDDSIVVKSSLAGAAFIGYRLGPYIAGELRYEGFDGFDLKGRTGRGEIDGYAITFNAKFYPLDGPIQPFLGVGVGGIHLKEKVVLNSGARIRESESDGLFRFFGGLDLPLTEHVILNMEAAYLLPTDDLSDLEIATMGGGLTFLF